MDVGLQVLFGTLGRALRQEDVSAVLLPERWTAPEDLRRAAQRYADESGFYDGDVARLHALDVSVHHVDGAERHRVRLTVARTGYFDYLATNVALGPFTPQTAPLLSGRGGLPETQLSNMMGLDLTLITSDGYVPVFHRSAGMAGLERCWQTSSGETVQLEVDRDTDGCPDVFHTARRGLEEELGIRPEVLEDLRITAFVSTPEFANVGVLVAATIAMSADVLERNLNQFVMSARDNWEYSGHDMIALDDPRALADALTRQDRHWTKQAVGSLIFAHALRANGDVGPLAEAIHEGGGLRLEAGSKERGILRDADPAVVPGRYCWRCATPLPRRPPVKCSRCGEEHYANPKPCGEAVVIDDGCVLLVQRANEPWQGCWDVPGGFCEGDEHPRDAARRELREEVGLAAEPVSYLGTWIDVYGDPAPDGLQDHTANSAYIMRLVQGGPARAKPDGNEILDARWIPLDRPPSMPLAFPDHLEAVLARARAWVEDPGRFGDAG